MRQAMNIVILILALALFPTITTNAQPMQRDAKIIYVNPAQAELFSWVRSGTLYWVDFGKNTPGCYIYRGASGHLIFPSASNTEIATLVRDEMKNAEELRSFVESKLAYVILSFLGKSHSHIITRAYIQNRETLPIFAWQNISPQDVSHSNQILKNYESDGHGVIKDGRWEEKFCVVLRNGSVETWNLNGSLDPFSINQLIREIGLKEGSIVPIPEVGL